MARKIVTKAKVRTYHHGDLRDTVIAATLDLIERDGIERLSLREVARLAGVSPRAPYQHFANKAALLAAIALRGYETLTETLRDAAAPATSPANTLRRMIDAYVAFARKHRAYFQVMFRPDVYDKPRYPKVTEASDRAMAIVLQAASAVYGVRATPVQVGELAVLVWSLAHGAASLLQEGSLQRRSALLQQNAFELLSKVSAEFERLLQAATASSRKATAKEHPRLRRQRHKQSS